MKSKPILFYHNVGSEDFKSFSTIDKFEYQMKFLYDRKFKAPNLENLDNSKSNIGITFDDGYEDNLINAYKRIRSSVRNGLAIVPIERNASGGSYFTIPPQVQMEIASRQKIITDEYSGRILVDPKLAEEEMDKMKSIFS